MANQDDEIIIVTAQDSKPTVSEDTTPSVVKPAHEAHDVEAAKTTATVPEDTTPSTGASDSGGSESSESK